MPLNIIEEQLNPVLENLKTDGVANTFIKAIYYKDGFKVKYDVIESRLKIIVILIIIP